MDCFAVIFDWWPATPVYHAFDDERLREGDDVGISASFTVCGRLVSEYNRETQRLREPGDWIPTKHARKFARPCRRCYSPAASPRGGAA